VGSKPAASRAAREAAISVGMTAPLGGQSSLSCSTRIPNGVTGLACRFTTLDITCHSRLAHFSRMHLPQPQRGYSAQMLWRAEASSSRVGSLTKHLPIGLGILARCNPSLVIDCGVPQEVAVEGWSGQTNASSVPDAITLSGDIASILRDRC